MAARPVPCHPTRTTWAPARRGPKRRRPRPRLAVGTSRTASPLTAMTDPRISRATSPTTSRPSDPFPNHERPMSHAGHHHASPAQGAQAVRRVFVITLLLNVAVAVAKAGYGYFSGSIALGTDAIHAVLDGSSNVLALFSLHWARI